jgi:two-component system chemotaxis response regulator CheB
MPPSPHSIRVLIVTADATLRQALLDCLVGPTFAIAGAVASAGDATRQCQEVQPDVAVVDAGLPGGAGFSAVQDIMAFRPTPILVIAPTASGPEAFQALALGALDVQARPPVLREAFGQDVAHRLRLLSGVRVIQHVRGRRRKRSTETLAGPPVIGIAASLGGPRALAILFKGLPRDLKAPICVVQHISDGFVQGLADWLASESGMPVREARTGAVLQPGCVLIAPSGTHLTVGEDDRVELDDGPAVEGFKPSGTRLLRSLAECYGRRTIGVVLTGMGRDGADGLAAVRAAGGRTLAQDEATSTVYGMPRAAVETGAVERVVAIDEMAPVLVGLVRDLLKGDAR